jgi:hypothetical protein
MGKLLSWIVLGLFLVVVPFISWYYLKEGLDYRKKALSELIAKDSISVKIDSLKKLAGKTTLLLNKSSKDVTDLIPPIQEQFKNTVGFQIISFDTVPGIVHLPENYLGQLRTKYSDQTFILIDTSLFIRNTYKHDMDAVRKMIEHIAIVIPRVKESDIKMKQ